MTRIDDYDRTEIASQLNRQGWAMFPKLLTADESDDVAGLYGDTPAFRRIAPVFRLEWTTPSGSES